MNFEVHPSDFNKTLEVPTSKSYANRLLILAAVKKEPVTIQGLPESTDVKFMLACLKKIGLDIQESPNKIVIKNSFPECETEKVIELETGDGGTTNRFLVPLLARGKSHYKLQTKGHMQNRPMGELLRVLQAGGAEASQPGKGCWISVQGPYQPQSIEIEIESSETTQFATGMALAFSDYDLKVKMIGAESSQKYFDITLNLIELSKNKNEFRVPVDFSSLSYPLAAALTRGEVLVTNCLERDFDQADSALIDIIPEVGASLSWSDKGLIVKSNNSYKAIERDCSNFPDLVPTLVYLAAYAGGESKLKNIKVLRHKESDRIEQCLKLLRLFEVEHDYDDEKDILSITGRAPISEKKIFEAPDDHRIVMVAYLFMKMNGGGQIENSEHVKKSFPTYFEAMEP